MSQSLLKIGANLKRMRAEKGLSQEDLARHIGADKAYISRIENGKINLTITSISKLAEVFKVSAGKLLE